MKLIPIIYLVNMYDDLDEPQTADTMLVNPPTSNGVSTIKNAIGDIALAVVQMPQIDMSDLSTLLDDLVAFSRHLRANPTSISKADLLRLEGFHQLLTYHVIYGARYGTDLEFGHHREPDLLVARRCSLEGCQGGPTLWNIRAGRLNGAQDWRCIDHIPRDMTFPVSLWGDEWKATGRK